jgi:hypothetical protein
MTSRRNLLLGLGGGSVAAAAIAAPVLQLALAKGGTAKTASWWDRTFSSLRDGGVQEWSALVGESFSLAAPGGATALKLIAVKAMPSTGLRPKSVARAQAFRAVFETAASARVPAGDRIYELTHRAHSPLQMYMSPSVLAGKKAQLVAIFN